MVSDLVSSELVSSEFVSFVSFWSDSLSIVSVLIVSSDSPKTSSCPWDFLGDVAPRVDFRVARLAPGGVPVGSAISQ